MYSKFNLSIKGERSYFIIFLILEKTQGSITLSHPPLSFTPVKAKKKKKPLFESPKHGVIMNAYNYNLWTKGRGDKV